MRFVRSIAPIATALLAAVPSQAQSTTPKADPRWEAYLGCWQTSAPGYSGPTVCVLPTEVPTRVELVAVADDSILTRTMLDASGTRTPVNRDGCTGWESATWSQDERRLFTRTEFTCGTAAAQVTTGMYAVNHAEAFAHVEGMRTKNGSRTRVVNFQWVDTVRVPSEIAARVRGLPMMRIHGARLESAAEVSTADVVEASQAVDGGVVEAWLGNRGQPFTVAARDLRAMRDAGVPTGVIDMVVAVSNPTVFVVAPGAQPDMRNAPQGRTMNVAERDLFDRNQRLRQGLVYGFGDFLYPYDTSMLDPFFSPFYGRLLAGSFMPYYSPYLYNGAFYNGYWNGGMYGNGFGNGVFFGGGNTIVGNGPYIIAPVQPARPEQPGRVVNGAGYSASNGSSGGTAVPTPSVGSGGYSNGGGSSSSGASSGGGMSSGGGGEQRTAKPRP